MEERIEVPTGDNALPQEVQDKLSVPNDDLPEFKDYTLEFKGYTPIIVIKRNIKTTEVVNLSKALYAVVIEGDIEQGAYVNVSSAIDVKGNIDSEATVISIQGSIIAKNIGTKSIIDAVRVIKV